MNADLCRRLAVHFLRDLSYRMGNAVCNDLELPSGLVSQDELEELAKVVSEDCDDEIPAEALLDWMAVDAVAAELERMS